MDDKNWTQKFHSLWSKFLLNTGFDINSLNRNGKTMLSYAAECGNFKIAEFLVLNGADANVANSDGSLPLHIAAKCGRKDIVKLFLNRGISVDSCDNDNSTSLHYVAVTNDISSAGRETYQELVHILVDSNANINAVNRKGCTPLLVAAQNSCKHMVELFIKFGSDLEWCDGNQWTVLHHACQNGWTGIVRTLVEGRFEIDLNGITSDRCTPVIIAAKRSHEDIVKLLIESGAEVEDKDDFGYTLLHYACTKGWLEIVKSLVSKGCYLDAEDKRGYTPVMIAACFSHPNVLDCLIKSGADVKCCNVVGLTLLHFACYKGSLETVKSLVSKGCDLNAIDELGQTSVMVATIYPHSNVIEYLIEIGADVRCCNVKGWTLLHYACSSGLLEIVKSLVNKGCDLNAKDRRGDTPLVIAAECSYLSVVEYLDECGADVDCSIAEGITLLHYACLKGWLEVVKSRTKKYVNAQTDNHVTPLHVAVELNHLEIVKYLLNSGDADCNVKSFKDKTAFNMYIHKSPCLEVIILFIGSGAYIQTDDCAVISNNSLLKQGILQNTQICTMALINKFNNADLHKMYDIPGVSEKLLSIEELKIAYQCTAAQNIAESVEFEIQTKGYCDLLKARPLFLRSLCLRSLFEYYDN